MNKLNPQTIVIRFEYGKKFFVNIETNAGFSVIQGFGDGSAHGTWSFGDGSGCMHSGEAGHYW